MVKKKKSRIKKVVRKTKSKSAKKTKRPVKKSKVSRKTPLVPGLEKIGEVTHYFPHVKAAAVMMLKSGLKVGDGIYIKGHTTDFKEKVSSIQLDRVPIEEAAKGQEIGLLVKSRVRIGDSVYRL